MGIFSRILNLIKMFFSGFVDSAESSVPLERRLAYDRVTRAENVKKQMGAAEDVGAAAEMMVQQLAEARILAANVRQEAKAHLTAAQAAGQRGDAVTQEQEMARASLLAEELAAAEGEVAGLEHLVEEALSDKKEAIAMVLEQSKQLEALSRNDARLVARARMTSMRREQLELRERMMDLVPGDQSNMRARIDEQVKKDEAKFRARRDVVDALWDQKKRSGTAQALQTSAAGAAKLAELKAELGIGEADTAPAPSVEAPPVAERTEAPAERAAGGEGES